MIQDLLAVVGGGSNGAHNGGSRVSEKAKQMTGELPPKNGHMIKFHEGAFHTALGSYSLMPNDSSDDYKTLPRTQRC